MKTVVMSDANPCFCRALEQQGYHIIPTKKTEPFSIPEQKHADMQLLRIRERIFTLEDCEDVIGGKYPENVRLNCLYTNDTLYGNLRAADASVLRFCRENGIRTVHVNQGYTRCSTLVLHDRAAITADASIEAALQQDGAEVLRISAGHIRLEGFDYGFIGGATFSDGRTVFTFGNIKKHPDYDKIKAFCVKNDSNIEILCEEEPLTDIGGAVILSAFSG